MLVYILFIAGFIFLLKGADILVKGSVSLARRYHIPEMVVGLTIVSFGTSMPELVVNILASIHGNSDMAIGNIFGSNIANVLLILGMSAIISPLPIHRNTVFSEIPFMLVATLLVGFLANASLFSSSAELSVSRTDGMIIMFFFILFMAYTFSVARNNKDEFSDEDKQQEITSLKSLFYIILGLTGLFLGGKWVVDGAVQIAGLLGMSESFIGLTIVAIGTSLPELVTSMVAASRKNIDIAVGNVIGSNIFNLLWILGVSAIIKPLDFEVINNLDILVMIFSSTLIILAMSFNRKRSIGRLSGVIFVLLYVVYIIYLIQRG
ncbi:MAG TPA: calcium/sodium antiporter [Bacteroidales bacterium]|nr:calcium/sodium antiporter [Bacteroidales bacterium]